MLALDYLKIDQHLTTLEFEREQDADGDALFIEWKGELASGPVRVMLALHPAPTSAFLLVEWFDQDWESIDEARTYEPSLEALVEFLSESPASIAAAL
jgi:hypothetical protein